MNEVQEWIYAERQRERDREREREREKERERMRWKEFMKGTVKILSYY